MEDQITIEEKNRKKLFNISRNQCTWSKHIIDKSCDSLIEFDNLNQNMPKKVKECKLLTDSLIVSRSFHFSKLRNELYVFNKCNLTSLSLIDISAIQRHRYLQYIDLSCNEIKSLKPLSGIYNLIYLNASHNKLKRVLDFKPSWFLTYVNLSFNEIKIIRDLSEFRSIVHLDLSHNQIEMITGLQALEHLQYLNLSHNFIERIENLHGLRIKELNLENNYIKSYICSERSCNLNSLPNLRVVKLGYNKLNSLHFFENVHGLHYVDLRCNKICDLLEVAYLKGSMYEVDFRGNPCTKWPRYRDLLLFSVPYAKFIDGSVVSSSEKASARITFAPTIDLISARTITKLNLLEQLNFPKMNPQVLPFNEIGPPLIVLCGPSAVKKITLAIQISKMLPNKIKYCRIHTTQELADNEEDKVAYIHSSRETFNEMMRRGEFFAVHELLGESYGLHVDQISSLILENKVGIAQMDINATIQIKNRLSNVRAVLVMTKDEKIHCNWIREKFSIHTWIKNSIENLLSVKVKEYDTGHETLLSKLSFIKNIVEEILSPRDQNNSEPLGSISDTTFNGIEYEQHEEIIQKFIPSNSESSEFLTDNNNSDEFKIILDENSELVANFKFKIYGYKELTYAQLLSEHSFNNPTYVDSTDSFSTKDITSGLDHICRRKDPEYLKHLYTKVEISSREIYLNYHTINPGFFSFTILTDDYTDALNSLIDYIHNLCIIQPYQQHKYMQKMEHIKKQYNNNYKIQFVIDKM